MIAWPTRLAARTAACCAAWSPGAHRAKKYTIVAWVVPSPWTEIGSTATKNTTGSAASASTSGTRTPNPRKRTICSVIKAAMCGSRTSNVRRWPPRPAFSRTSNTGRAASQRGRRAMAAM